MDDASNEDRRKELSDAFPGFRFLRNESRQLLAGSRNAGASASKGDYLFFLDDDNVIDKDSIGFLARQLGRAESVAVSCPIIYYLSRPEEVWTSSILRNTVFPGFYKLHKEVPIAGTTAKTFAFHNSFMVKRTVFDELCGFDSATFPIRFGEVDFAHRLQARGYVALVVPEAKVWHDLGWQMAHVDSTRAYYTERNRIIVVKKYFSRRDFVFYCFSILPFITGYLLVHHFIAANDGRLRAASGLLRGVAAGLAFHEQR